MNAQISDWSQIEDWSLDAARKQGNFIDLDKLLMILPVDYRVKVKRATIKNPCTGVLEEHETVEDKCAVYEAFVRAADDIVLEPEYYHMAQSARTCLAGIDECGGIEAVKAELDEVVSKDLKQQLGPDSSAFVLSLLLTWTTPFPLSFPLPPKTVLKSLAKALAMPRINSYGSFNN